MLTSTLLTILATFSLTTARIINISAPDTIRPNSTFPLTLVTEGYVQSVDDIAVVWGFTTPPGYPFTIGSYGGSKYLGPKHSNIKSHITFAAASGEDLEHFLGKEVLLNVAVWSLYGASATPTVMSANVTVKVSEKWGKENKNVKSGGSVFSAAGEK